MPDPTTDFEEQTINPEVSEGQNTAPANITWDEPKKPAVSNDGKETEQTDEKDKAILGNIKWDAPKAVNYNIDVKAFSKIKAKADLLKQNTREFAIDDESPYSRAEQRWLFDAKRIMSDKDIEEGMKVFDESNKGVFGGMYYFDPKTLKPKKLGTYQTPPIDPDTGQALQLFGANSADRFLVGLENGAITGAGVASLFGGLPGAALGGVVGGLLLGTINAFAEDEDYIAARKGNTITDDGTLKTMLKTFNNTLLTSGTGVAALMKLASEGIMGNETIFSDLYTLTKQQADASQLQINPFIPQNFQSDEAYDNLSSFFSSDNYNLEALPVGIAQGLASMVQFIGASGSVRALAMTAEKVAAKSSTRIAEKIAARQIAKEGLKARAREFALEGNSKKAKEMLIKAGKVGNANVKATMTQFAGGMIMNNQEIMQQLEGVDGLSLREKAAYGMLTTMAMASIEMLGGPDAAFLRHQLKKNAVGEEVIVEIADSLKKMAGKKTGEKLSGKELRKIYNQAYYSYFKKASNVIKKGFTNSLGEAAEEFSQSAVQDLSATFTNYLYGLDDEHGFNSDMASPETWANYFNSAVGGFTTGLVGGSAGMLKASRISSSIGMASVAESEFSKAKYESTLGYYLSKKNISEDEYQRGMEMVEVFDNFNKQVKDLGLTRGQKKDAFVHLYEMQYIKPDQMEEKDLNDIDKQRYIEEKTAFEEILKKAGEIDPRKKKAEEERIKKEVENLKRKVEEAKKEANSGDGTDKRIKDNIIETPEDIEASNDEENAVEETPEDIEASNDEENAVEETPPETDTYEEGKEVEMPENESESNNEDDSNGIEKQGSLNDHDTSGIYIKDGKKGAIKKDGQTYVFETNDQIIELGNVDEIGNNDLSDYGIELEKKMNITVGENNEVSIDGKNYINENSDPLQAINHDKDGNVISINLTNEKDQKRTIRGQRAEEIAYQYKLKQFEDNATEESIARAHKEIDRLETEAAKAKSEREKSGSKQRSKSGKTELKKDQEKEKSKKEKSDRDKKEEPVSKKELKEFIDNNKVSVRTVRAITDKHKEGKELSPNEKTIYASMSREVKAISEVEDANENAEKNPKERKIVKTITTFKNSDIIVYNDGTAELVSKIKSSKNFGKVIKSGSTNFILNNAIRIEQYVEVQKSKDHPDNKKDDSETEKEEYKEGNEVQSHTNQKFTTQDYVVDELKDEKNNFDKEDVLDADGNIVRDKEGNPFRRFVDKTGKRLRGITSIISKDLKEKFDDEQKAIESIQRGVAQVNGDVSKVDKNDPRVKALLANWKYRTEEGTKIHGYAESIVNGMTMTKFREGLKGSKEEKKEQMKVFTEMRAFIKSKKNESPGSKMLAEQEIIDSETGTVLIADLLRINKDGSIDIFDFKVKKQDAANHEYMANGYGNKYREDSVLKGVNQSSASDYSIQLKMAKRALERKGYTVNSTIIVPVGAKFETSQVGTDGSDNTIYFNKTSEVKVGKDIDISKDIADEHLDALEKDLYAKRGTDISTLKVSEPKTKVPEGWEPKNITKKKNNNTEIENINKRRKAEIEKEDKKALQNQTTKNQLSVEKQIEATRDKRHSEKEIADLRQSLEDEIGSNVFKTQKVGGHFLETDAFQDKFLEKIIIESIKRKLTVDQVIKRFEKNFTFEKITAEHKRYIQARLDSKTNLKVGKSVTVRNEKGDYEIINSDSYSSSTTKNQHLNTDGTLNSQVELERIKAENSEFAPIIDVILAKKKALRTSITISSREDLNAAGESRNTFEGADLLSDIAILLDVVNASRGLSDKMSKSEANAIMLHEEIHRYTATVLALSQNPELRQLLSESEKQFAEDLTKLWDLYRQNPDQKFLAVNNLNEFIAYGLTDQNFIKVLQGRKIGKDSIFSRILDAIQKLFGKNDPNIHDGIKSVFDTFMKQDSPTINRLKQHQFYKPINMNRENKHMYPGESIADFVARSEPIAQQIRYGSNFFDVYPGNIIVGKDKTKIAYAANLTIHAEILGKAGIVDNKWNPNRKTGKTISPAPEVKIPESNLSQPNQKVINALEKNGPIQGTLIEKNGKFYVETENHLVEVNNIRGKLSKNVGKQVTMVLVKRKDWNPDGGIKNKVNGKSYGDKVTVNLSQTNEFLDDLPFSDKTDTVLKKEVLSDDGGTIDEGNSGLEQREAVKQGNNEINYPVLTKDELDSYEAYFGSNDFTDQQQPQAVEEAARMEYMRGLADTFTTTNKHIGNDSTMALMNHGANIVEKEYKKSGKFPEALTSAWRQMKDIADRMDLPLTAKMKQIWERSILRAHDSFDNILKWAEKFDQVQEHYDEVESDEVTWNLTFGNEDAKADLFGKSKKVLALYESVPGIHPAEVKDELYNFIFTPENRNMSVEDMLKKMRSQGSTISRFAENIGTIFPQSDFITLVNAISSSKKRPYITLFLKDAAGKKSHLKIINKDNTAERNLIGSINAHRKALEEAGVEFSNKSANNPIPTANTLWGKYLSNKKKLENLIKSFNKNAKKININGKETWVVKDLASGKEFSVEQIAKFKLKIEVNLLTRATGITQEQAMMYVNTRPAYSGYNDVIDFMLNGKNSFVRNPGSESKPNLSWTFNTGIVQNIFQLYNKENPTGRDFVNSDEFFKSLRNTLIKPLGEVLYNGEYASKFYNEEGNLKSSSPIESSTLNIADNIQDVKDNTINIGNPFLKLYRDVMKMSMPVFIVSGIKDMKSKLGASGKNISTEDIELLEYMGYHNSDNNALLEDQYFQTLGQFGDKALQALVPAKKYMSEEAVAEIEKIRSSDNPNAKYFPSNKELRKEIFYFAKKIKTWNESGTFGSEKMSELNDDNYGKQAQDYVLNYVINKYYLDQIFAGRLSNYGKDKESVFKGRAKRSASFGSGGMHVMIGIDGGLKETYSQAIFNDSAIQVFLDIDGVKKSIDNEFENGDGILFQTEEHEKQIQVSAGTAIELKNSLKALYADIDDSGNPILDKLHRITITKEMADANPNTLGVIYDKMHDENNPIDTFVFTSGAKLYEQIDQDGNPISVVNELQFDENGKIAAFGPEKLQNNKPTVDKTKTALELSKTPVIREENGQTIVNTMRKKDTSEHFGNPFTGIKSVAKTDKSLILMPTVEAAVEAYKKWISGANVGEILGDELISTNLKKLSDFGNQRMWIEKQINSGKLDNAQFEYMNKDDGNYFSHADALVQIINEKNQKETTNENPAEIKVVPRKSKNLRIQQNLNNDGKKKDKRLIPQMIRHLKRLVGTDIIDKHINDSITQKANNFKYELGNMNQNEKREFLLSILDENENNAEIRDLLYSGVSLNHPLIETYMLNTVISGFKKNVLDIMSKGSLLTTISDMIVDKKLLGPRVVDGVSLPGQVMVSEDSGYKKGDIFFITRMPADDLHSITRVEVIGFLPASMGNKIVVDQVTRKIAGEDLDGDQRHIWASDNSNKAKYLDPNSEEAKKKLLSQNLAKAKQNALRNYFIHDWTYYAKNSKEIFKNAPKFEGDRDNLSQNTYRAYEEELDKYLSDFFKENNHFLFKSDSPIKGMNYSRKRYYLKFTNSPEAIVQKMFEQANKAYADPKNYDAITNPVDTKRLDDILSMNPVKEGLDNSNVNMPSTSSKIYNANKGTSGKGNVISVVAKTISTLIEMDGNNIGYRNKTKKGSQNLKEIYSLLGDALNQATDNAKEQKLHLMRLNSENAGIWLSMAVQGNSLESIIQFMDSDKVKKFYELVERQKMISDTGIDNNESVKGLFKEIFKDESGEYDYRRQEIIGRSKFYQEMNDLLNHSNKIFKLGQIFSVIESGVSSWADLQMINQSMKSMPSIIPENSYLSKNIKTAINGSENALKNFSSMFLDKSLSLAHTIKQQVAKSYISIAQAQAIERLVSDQITKESFEEDLSEEQLLADLKVAIDGIDKGNFGYFDYADSQYDNYGEGSFGLDKAYTHNADNKSMEDARKEFEKLPNNIQELLLQYNAIKYNSTYSTKGAAVTRTISTTKQIEFGKRKDKTIARWKKEAANYSDEQVREMIISNPDLIPFENEQNKKSLFVKNTGKDRIIMVTERNIDGKEIAKKPLLAFQEEVKTNIERRKAVESGASKSVLSEVKGGQLEQSDIVKSNTAGIVETMKEDPTYKELYSLSKNDAARVIRVLKNPSSLNRFSDDEYAKKIKFSMAIKKFWTAVEENNKPKPSIDGFTTINQAIIPPILKRAKSFTGENNRALENNKKSGQEIHKLLVEEFMKRTGIAIDLNTLTYEEAHDLLAMDGDKVRIMKEREDKGLNGSWRDDAYNYFFGKAEPKDTTGKIITSYNRADDYQDRYEAILNELKEVDEKLKYPDLDDIAREEYIDREDELNESLEKLKEEGKVESPAPAPMTKFDFKNRLFGESSFAGQSVNSLPKQAQAQLNEAYKKYLKEWINIDNTYFAPQGKLFNEQNLHTYIDSKIEEGKAKGKKVTTAMVVQDLVDEIKRSNKSIAAEFPLKILNERLAKEQILEMIRQEASGKFNGRNVATRALYDILTIVDNQNEDWGASELESGKYALKSPSRLIEAVMQLNETLLREKARITEIETADLNDKLKEIFDRIRKNKADINDLTYTEKDKHDVVTQYFHGINSPEYQAIKEKANLGDEGSKALIELYETHLQEEEKTGNYSYDAKEKAYRVPQQEADTWEILFGDMGPKNKKKFKEILKSENIIKTFKSKYASQSYMDDYNVNADAIKGLKKYGVTGITSYGEIKKALIDKIKPNGSVLNNARIIRQLRAVQEYAVELQQKGIDDIGAATVLHALDKINPKVGFEKTDTTTMNIAASISRHHQGMIFKKNFEGIEPIMSFLEDHLERSGMKNMKRWLDLHNQKVLYGQNPESNIKKYEKYINALSSLTYAAMLAGNWISGIFNVGQGVMRTLSEIHVQKMGKGAARIVQQIGTANPHKAVIANRAIKVLKMFDIVSVSKDTEMNITNRTVNRASNIAFLNISVPEYFNHALSFIGEMTNREWAAISPLVDSGATRREIVIALGKATDQSAGTGNTNEEVDFRNGILRINQLQEETQRINGSYHPSSRRLYNNTPEGRFVMMFKNWIPELVLSHSSKEFYDMYDYNRKGSTKTAGEMIKKLHTKAGWKALAYTLTPGNQKFKYDGLSDVDKRNIQKLIKEVLALGAISLAMAGIFGDDDDDLTADQKQMKLLLDRLMSDSVYFWNPQSYVDLIEAPFPASKTLENIVKMSAGFITGDKYKTTNSTIEEGGLKAWHYVEKNTPLWNQYSNTARNLTAMYNYVNND